MKEATYDFHAAFELNAGIAQTFVQVINFIKQVSETRKRALVLSFQRKHKQIVEEFDQKAKYEIVNDQSLYLLIAKARMKCGDNRGMLSA